jgi:hypothetical protein
VLDTIILEDQLMSILEEGPLRRFLRERQLLKGLWQPPAIYPPVDRELEMMREAKKREWKAKGYPEDLIEHALMLADRWSSSMAATWAPPDRPGIREEILRSAYPRALEVGQKWIEAMAK